MATQTQVSGSDMVRQRAPREPQPIAVELPGLWKAMILTSFAINLVLVFVVLFLLLFLFWWRGEIGATTQGVQGFAHDNVAELRDVVDQLEAAHIRTTIPLDKPLPLRGAGVSVPVDQVTEVTLVQDVDLTVNGAEIDLGAGNRLRAAAINLSLPAGTRLPIALKMNIPLDDVTIPVKLDVPVDIALAETELGPQFRRLGNVVDRLAYPAAPLLGLDIPPPEPAQVPR